MIRALSSSLSQIQVKARHRHGIGGNNRRRAQAVQLPPAAPPGHIRGTCTRLGVEGYRYLLDVIRKLEAGWPMRRLSELIPRTWAAATCVPWRASSPPTMGLQRSRGCCGRHFSRESSGTASGRSRH